MPAPGRGVASRALTGRFELDEPLGPTVIDEAEAEMLPEIEASYTLELERQPELLSACAGLELAQLDVEAAKDALRPAFSLDVARERYGVVLASPAE